MITVIGHKNPDTDSVVSALIFARFLQKEGKEAAAAITAEINRETKFVFSRFKEEVPEKVTGKQIKEDDFFLVDHNDLGQSVATREKVWGVLDHHLLAGLKTDTPLYFRVEPLGSTATLIYKMIKEKGEEVNKKEAGLLLCGIISDTLNLNSSTTTSEDIDFYYELSAISEEDGDKLAKEMFAAKSDFSGMDIKEIILGDYKDYSFGKKKIGIGVAEVTSLDYFQKKEKDFLKKVEEIKKEKGLDIFFFGAVDIIQQNTQLYPGGEEEKEISRKLFQGEEKENYFFLPEVSSRKSQIAPPLCQYYEKN